MSTNLPSGRERTPERGALLRILSRRPLRRFYEPLERARKRRQGAEFAPEISGRDDLALVYEDERMRLATSERGITRQRARRRNVQLAVQLFEDASVPYFAVPDQERRHTSIGVEGSDWQGFIDALEAAELQPPLYLGVETEDRHGKVHRSVFPADSPEGRRALRAQDSVELFQFHTDPAQKQVFGRPEACRIERWRRDDEGTLETTAKNHRVMAIGSGAQVRATVQVNGLELSTYEPLGRPSMFENRKPIDVVYLWVDGQDPEWSETRDSVIAELTGTVPSNSSDPSRFRDNGELRYSLRSIFHHCDWVRNIILVTDSQVPPWLDTSHPRIRMVTHQELFGSSGRLPTYNSHAITSRIHHLDGLSEQFLILNDDVFVGHDIGPEKFFLSNGMSKFFMSQATLRYTNSYQQAHEAARRNVVDLIHRDFGVAPSRIFCHTPVPQLRSLLFELEERYPDLFETTWSHQLRSPDDFQINSWMHHYIGYLLRRTVPGTIPYTYFSLGAKNLKHRLEALLANRWAATFCLNDSPEASAENLKFLKGWLERYYPVPAPWEYDAT